MKKNLQLISNHGIQTSFQKSFLTLHWAKSEYDYSTRRYSTTIKRNAEAYVFCFLKEKDADHLDPFNLNHWELYIVLTKDLDECIPEQ